MNFLLFERELSSYFFNYSGWEIKIYYEESRMERQTFSYIWADTGSKKPGVTSLRLPTQKRKYIVWKFMLGWNLCLYRREMIPNIEYNHFVRQRIHRLLFMSLSLFYLESIFIVCVCGACVWLCVYGACVCVVSVF